MVTIGSGAAYIVIIKMQKTKKQIASPTTPKKTRMTSEERKESNIKHN